MSSGVATAKLHSRAKAASEFTYQQYERRDSDRIGVYGRVMVVVSGFSAVRPSFPGAARSMAG